MAPGRTDMRLTANNNSAVYQEADGSTVIISQDENTASDPNMTSENCAPSGEDLSYDPAYFDQMTLASPGVMTPGAEMLYSPDAPEEFQYYPPGVEVGSDPSEPTIFLTEDELAKFDTKDASEVAPSLLDMIDADTAAAEVDRQITRREREKFITPYPLLNDATIAFNDLVAERAGEPKEPDSHIVIDLELAETYYADEAPISSEPDRVYVPTNDPNLMNLPQAVSVIIEARRSDEMDVPEARVEIEKMQNEMAEYDTEKLSKRADDAHKKLGNLKKAKAALREKLNELNRDLSRARSAITSEAPIDEDLMCMPPEIPKAEAEIAALDRKIHAAGEALRGTVKAVVLQDTMTAMYAQDDAPRAFFGSAPIISEDELLSEAGKTFATFDLDDEAYESFSQAREVAGKIGDMESQTRQKLHMITHDTSISEEERIAEYFGYIDSVEEAYRADISMPYMREGEMPLYETPVALALRASYQTIRAEATAQLLKLTARAADDDPEDGNFMAALAMLDQEIAAATKASNTSPMEVAHLVSAAKFAAGPFVEAAALEAREPDIEAALKYFAPMLARKDRVEELYKHLQKIDPDAGEDFLVANALGEFGEEVYFNSYQKLGFAYEGVRETFGKFVPNYPDSLAKRELVSMIREKAPHLFDEHGKYLPPEKHNFAPDADRAEEEIEKLNYFAGAWYEQGLGDIAGSAIVGGTVGLVSSVAGPAGFFAGAVGGSKFVNMLHEDEIEERVLQARMSGMQLAGLSWGEGDKNVATSVSLLALAALASPSGSRAAARLAGRVKDMLSPEGRNYIREVLVDETKGFVMRRYRAAGPALRALLGINTQNARYTRAIIESADDIVTKLGFGKKAGGRIESIEEVIAKEARDELDLRFTEAGLEANQGFHVAEALVPMDRPTVAKLKGFRRLLRGVEKEMAREKFETELAKIVGRDDNKTVNIISKHLFENGGKTAEELASRLNLILGKTSTEGGEALARRVTDILKFVDEAGREPMLRSLNTVFSSVDVETWLRISELVRRNGTPVAQVERLLKDMVRDGKMAPSLLETILTAPMTREEYEAAARRVGARYDPKLLEGMVSAESRKRVHGAIGGALRFNTISRRLHTKEFMESMLEIEGMGDFLKRFALSKTRVFSYDVSTSASRDVIYDLIQEIAKDDQACREFVERILGKNLSERARQKMPQFARQKLLDAVTKWDETSTGPLSKAIKSVQHEMKDALRPVISDWQNAHPWDYTDANLRTGWRTNRRLVTEAVAYLDEDGERLVRELTDSLPPWRKKELNGHIQEAVEMMILETRKTLAGQIKKTMGQTPVNGIFDRFLRPANGVWDEVAEFVDGKWTRWIGTATRAAVEAEPKIDILRGPLLLRKALLRNAYRVMAGEAAGKTAKEPGAFLRGLEKSVEWMSKNVGTEEFRRAHRLCIPVALADKLIDGKMGETGTICAILGANYYMQRLNLATTHALDLALIQRLSMTSVSKNDGGSEELIDNRRFGAMWKETAASLVIQNAMMYGLNFAEKASVIQAAFSMLPLVRRVPLAMNSSTFFGFYSGSNRKPEFMNNLAGLGFATITSVAQAYSIAHIFKKKELFDADQDYSLWRGSNYALNGPTCNLLGFQVSSRLKGSPIPALGDTTRQVAERSMGTLTLWLTMHLADTFAGKGVYRTKEDRLLAEAVNGNGQSSVKAWDNFADRYSMDIVGTWYRLNFRHLSAEPGRTPRLHIGPAINIKQMRSWYSKKELEYGENDKGPGYFVRLAREHPDRLQAFLLEFERQLTDPNATWRAHWIPWRRTAHSKKLYYFALMAKRFAYLCTERKKTEYGPFADLVNSPGFSEFWTTVPLRKTEDDLEKAIFEMEDKGTITTDSDEVISVEDLLAYVRVKRLIARTN